jgi:glutamate racemase
MIGVFDSGVGGLSVVRALWKELPGTELLYLADQAHVPYGSRPLEEVRQFSVAISKFLLDQGAQIIVVACNTASAAALHYLRQQFPSTPFVGMEPAIKPAAEQTRSARVGVLATPATFQGALYASVVERFANGVQLFQDTCPGLVNQIEVGELDTPATRQILKKAIQPMLAEGIDTIVLGCTHYPFVIPLIQQISGPNIRVIDPAPAIARQARRIMESMLQPQDSNDQEINHPQITRLLTSGDPDKMEKLLPELLGWSASVEKVGWQNDALTFL